MKLNQKGLIQWIALLILAVALPAVLYLTKHPQIFKPKAFGNPPLEFLGPGVSEGNPPQTTSQNVQLRLTYSPSTPGSPPPSSPPPSSPTPTQGSLQATVTGSGSQVQVKLEWSGIDTSGSVRIFLRSSLFPTADVLLGQRGSCLATVTNAAGSCFFELDSTNVSQQLTFKFKKVLGPGNFVDLATSNQVTIPGQSI